jgi:NitT/TauT family transport system substrate-binding protein
VIFYSGAFATQKPEVARKFLKAFIRGVRDHNDALDANGRFVGEKGEEIIRILNEYTPIKDPQVYRTIVPNGIDPDGKVNIPTLKEDYEVYKMQGWIEGAATVEDVIDMSFVEAALKDLGPYKRG